MRSIMRGDRNRVSRRRLRLRWHGSNTGMHDTAPALRARVRPDRPHSVKLRTDLQAGGGEGEFEPGSGVLAPPPREDMVGVIPADGSGSWPALIAVFRSSRRPMSWMRAKKESR